MKEVIDNIYQLNEVDFDSLLEITRPVHFKKGELILRGGETCKGIYFIDAGIIGLYKLYKDREHYQDFFFEGNFATNIISLTSGEPSEECLVAIEEVKGRFISKDSLIGLYQKSTEFKEFGRRLLELLLANNTQLSFIRSSLTAKEKYEYIMTELPHYIQRLPLQFLASYLGMTRETLSRMRSTK